MKTRKNKYDFDSKIVVQDIETLELNLIYTLQMNISNNIFVDESNQPIKLDNKYICYPKGLYHDFNLIQFDPVFNRKLSQFLLQEYLRLYITETQANVISFFISYSLFNKDKICAVLRTTTGDISSNYYDNESMCWLDLIFKLDGQPIDNTSFQNMDKYINFVKEMEI